MISGCKYFLKWHTIVHAKSSSVYKHSKVLLYHKCSISLQKKKKSKEKCFGLSSVRSFCFVFLAIMYSILLHPSLKPYTKN